MVVDGCSRLKFFPLKSRRNVALLIETSNAYARGVLQGVIRFVHQHEPWSIYLPEQERTSRPPQWLEDWHGDGIIARIETAEVADLVARKGIPAVDVSAARRVQDIPWVETDDRVMARMAFDHLWERGFRNLAFVGDPGFNWSLWRQQHFEACVSHSGCEYSRHESVSRLDPNYSWDREKESLATWLRSLSLPVGIFACYDIKAQQVLDVCRELDLAVPEQVALIGADNDQLLCNLSDPPLTSVIPNSQRAGYEAARLLERMMNGEDVETDAVLVEPLGIQTRQSTDTLAIEDAEIAEVLRFIRQHACDGINVSDVLKNFPTSRRVIERKFRKTLGCTPHEEIVRQRIARVKQLLSSTELPLREIAERAGFEHTEYLTVAFKRETNLTPTQYRKNTGGR